MRNLKPKKIIMEYEDGSKAESVFEDLPITLQLEILRQPFAGGPSPDPGNEKFVLLEWDDGWKEVMEVDRRCTEINRYYVITRPEDVGRLSLHKEDGYPELIEIMRKPLTLKRISFLDTFQLTIEKSSREGKKTDHFFRLDKNGDALEEEMDSLKNALKDEGLDLSELSSKESGQLFDQYEKIRRQMGIKAAHRQQDVFDFISHLACSLE